jgi:hypothetical protein
MANIFCVSPKTELPRPHKVLAEAAHAIDLLVPRRHSGGLVAVDHRVGHAVPRREARLRLVDARVRGRFCRLHYAHDWIPDQLPLSVSPLSIFIPLVSLCTVGFWSQSIKTLTTSTYRYFIVTNLANGEAEVIRYAALLRGTESAWQAVSYGLTSIQLFAQVGAIYLNFGFWALAIVPAWLVVRHFGQTGLGAPDEPVLHQSTETPVKAGSKGESD